MTAETPPMKPPYQTSPPRDRSILGSPVRATYQSLAPMTPPITAATTMSAPYSWYQPFRRSSRVTSHPPTRKASIIMMPNPVISKEPIRKTRG